MKLSKVSVAEALTPVRVTAEAIAPWVALVESAYRGDASRTGWTTEADLLSGQRLNAAMAAEVLAQDDTVVFAVPAHVPGVDEASTSAPEAVTAFAASVQLVRINEREAYLGMFAVSPDQQGSGLGSHLMAWAENWVRSQWGVRNIRMTVIRQRSELIEFYRRRGYEPTGETEPFPYDDERFGTPLRDDLEFVVLSKRFSESLTTP